MLHRTESDEVEMKKVSDRNIQFEIDMLDSALEEAEDLLGRAEEQLRSRVRWAGEIKADTTEFIGDLMKRMAGFGPMFLRQLEEVHNVIKSTKAVTSLLAKVIAARKEVHSVPQLV